MSAIGHPRTISTRPAPAALAGLLGCWLLLAAAPAFAVCGDGIVEVPEACDDGGTIAGDGCSATCTLEPNSCLDNVTGVTNNCTANDVRLAVIAEIVESDGCDFPGDTAQVQIQTSLIATAAERYDIGIFIALDGGTARTGSCHHNYLPPPLADLGSYNPDRRASATARGRSTTPRSTRTPPTPAATSSRGGTPSTTCAITPSRPARSRP